METKIIITRTEMARIGYNTNITRIIGYVCLPEGKEDNFLDVALALDTIQLLGSKDYLDIAKVSIKENKVLFNVLKNN